MLSRLTKLLVATQSAGSVGTIVESLGESITETMQDMPAAFAKSLSKSVGAVLDRTIDKTKARTSDKTKARTSDKAQTRTTNRPEGEPATEETTMLVTLGWISAGLGAVALGLFVGRELRQRYKFNRRTPYDFYSHSGDEHDLEFGVGV